MSGEVPKPVVTKAGNKPVERPIEQKKGLFSRSKKKQNKPKSSKRADKKLAKQEKNRQKAKQQAEAAQTARKSKSQSVSSGETAKKTKKLTRFHRKSVNPAVIAPETKQKGADSVNSGVKHHPSRKVRRLSRKSQVIGGLAVAVLLGLMVFGVTRPNDNGQVSSDSTEADLLGDTTVVVTDSDFTTIGSATSGDASTRYDTERGYFSFRDNVAGQVVTVNQQPVPPGVKLTADILLQDNDWTSVGQFDTQKGPVYIARVEDSPTHAVAFEFKDLWIFIRTDFDISTQQWVDYINSLN